jgi:hypothetical protein
MTNTSSVPRRVLDRSLRGIWRQRGALLLYSGVFAAVVGYVAFSAPSTSSSSVKAASTPDCADAVMAAVVGRGTAPVQQEAYQCMGPELQQRVFQDGLGSQYRTIASTAVGKVSRVGTHQSDGGPTLVYYAVDAGDQSVGFVLHLDADGKVTQIS